MRPRNEPLFADEPEWEPDQTRALFIIAYGAVAFGGGIIGLIAGLLIGGVI